MSSTSGPALPNHARNQGVPLQPDWFDHIAVNTQAAERRAATMTTRRTVKKEWQAAWLVRAIELHRPDDAGGRRYRAA